MGVVVGDQVTRILAERRGTSRKMTISNNINVKNISKKDITIGDEVKQGLAFEFTFVSNYGNTGTKIELDITVFYSGNKKELDDLEKLWKDKKAVSEKVVLPVNNRALEVGMLQAIALAHQLRLPMPVRLPKFVLETKKKEEKKEAKAKAS